MRCAKLIALEYAHFIVGVCEVFRFYGSVAVAIGIVFGLVKGFALAWPFTAISAALLAVGLASGWLEPRIANALEALREADEPVAEACAETIDDKSPVRTLPAWWPNEWPSPKRVALHLAIGIPILNAWSWFVLSAWMKYVAKSEPMPSFIDHLRDLSQGARGDTILAIAAGMLLGQMCSLPLLILVIPITSAVKSDKVERAWRWYGEFAGTNVTAALLVLGFVLVIGLIAEFLGWKGR